MSWSLDYFVSAGTQQGPVCHKRPLIRSNTGPNLEHLIYLKFGFSDIPKVAAIYYFADHCVYQSALLKTMLRKGA
jgi:hypothetical protein